MKHSFQMFSRDDFGRSQAEANSTVNAHYHGWYEIYYLSKGTRRYFIETSIYDLREGDVVLVPEMTVHQTMRIPGSEPTEQHERYLLSPYKNDVPAVFLPLFEKRHYRLSPDIRHRIHQCFEDLEQTTRQNNRYHSHYLHANMVKILCLLAMAEPKQAETSLSAVDRRMHEAAEYIKEHCCEPLSLATVAKKFGYSREYFSSVFKHSTGLGFSEYLNHMRISHAVHLLQTSDWSITKVTTVCGFNDSSYFASVFKRATGLSPQKFRTDQQTRIIK